VYSCGFAEDLRPETMIPSSGQDWEASRQGKLLQSTSYEKYSGVLLIGEDLSHRYWRKSFKQNILPLSYCATSIF
jgi:hypothetical protein